MPAPATPPVDPTAAILAGIATHQRGLFNQRNLKIRQSTVVHGVRFFPWVAGLELPGPACGQGWSGAGLSGELHAVAEPVTCHHCRHSAQGRAATRGVDFEAGQLSLDLDMDGDQAGLGLELRQTE